MNTLLLIGALAAVPPIPSVSGPVTTPGMMYPNPPVGMVATAKQVEDFPYITEEYLVSGTANGAPYTTRIILRRPQNPAVFSGTVIGEALHQVEENEPSFRAEHSDVPWDEAYGMRNLLSHGYFKVRPELVWSTVKENLPGLRGQLVRILTPGTDR